MSHSGSKIAGDDDQENDQVNKKISHFFSNHKNAKRKRNDCTEAMTLSKPAVTDEQQPEPKLDTKQTPVVIDLLDDSESEGSADQAVGQKASQPSDSAKELAAAPPFLLANRNNEEPKVLPKVSPSEAAAAPGSTNPFAQFAFSGASSSSFTSNTIRKPPVTSWQQAAKKAKCVVHPSSTASSRNSNSSNNNKQKPMQDLKSNSSKTNPTKRGNTNTTKAKNCGDFVRMKDISPQEQAKIVRKWHDMVVDKTASLHDRRFQVFVAARLHARCQEGQVRKAMKALHAHFAAAAAAAAAADTANIRSENKGHQDSQSSLSSPLSVQSLAKADPESFVKAITNLQYHNTKAKQLVLAAKEIKIRHGGKVPEREHSLKQITGIGPVFADLLAFVNTEAKHKEAEVLTIAAAAEETVMD